MKKKTFIIIASLVYTFILIGILGYRLYLIHMDNSGLYELKNDSFIFFYLTFLPEISIVLTLFATNIRKGWGLFFTVFAGIMTIIAFISELFIKIVKSIDIVNRVNVPLPCIPWLNIPVFIIIIILFIFKFHIFQIPNTIGVKTNNKRR